MEVTYVSCVGNVLEGEVYNVDILLVMILSYVHVKLQIPKFVSNGLKRILQRFIRAICAGSYENNYPQQKKYAEREFCQMLINPLKH